MAILKVILDGEDMVLSGGSGGGSSVEVDPTVPAWAKEPNKPSYTAEEVGALPDTVVIPTKLSDLTNDVPAVSVADVQAMWKGEY